MRLHERFRYEYGAEPLHLVALLASFLLTGYAVLRVVEVVSPWSFVIWFLGAVIVHDLVLLPVYSLIEMVVRRTTRSRVARAAGRSSLNYVRVPGMLSALLLLVWFPLILKLAPASYESNAGLRPDPYLERWLLVSGAMFIVSGTVFVVQRGRARGQRANADGAQSRADGA